MKTKFVAYFLGVTLAFMCNGTLLHAQKLSPFQKEKMSKNAKYYVDNLNKHISRFGSKKNLFRDQEALEDEINTACELFISESNFVNPEDFDQPYIEVKRINRTGIKRTPRKYFWNLYDLEYDSVKIETSEINFVSELREGPSEGIYEGIISYVQNFRGYKGEKAVIDEKTRKNIKVIVKRMSSLGPVERDSWRILLGDVTVTSVEAG